MSFQRFANSARTRKRHWSEADGRAQRSAVTAVDGTESAVLGTLAESENAGPTRRFAHRMLSVWLCETRCGHEECSFRVSEVQVGCSWAHLELRPTLSAALCGLKSWQRRDTTEKAQCKHAVNWSTWTMVKAHKGPGTGHKGKTN